MATRTAPGLFRQQWPFQAWPDFDARAWRACLADARDAHTTWAGTLLGNDIHSGALSLAARCCCSVLLAAKPYQNTARLSSVKAAAHEGRILLASADLAGDVVRMLEQGRGDGGCVGPGAPVAWALRAVDA